LHRTRLLDQGYNQSALLAAPLARMLGVRFVPGLLRRVRATPPQAELSRLSRLRNLQGAFRVARPLHGRSVLVVDDVATTYATLHEVRRVLEAAGARSVRTLVLARTERQV
jgi:predicted amidophosphoribosyltransferase